MTIKKLRKDEIVSVKTGRKVGMVFDNPGFFYESPEMLDLRERSQRAALYVMKCIHRKVNRAASITVIILFVIAVVVFSGWLIGK